MAKKLLLGFLLALSQVSWASNFAFQLSDVQLSALAKLYFTEVEKAPYVLDDDLVKDARLVSVNLSGDASLIRAQFLAVLKQYGYTYSRSAGVQLFHKLSEDLHTLVYKPKHRTADYLATVLRSSSVVTSSRPINSPVKGKTEDTTSASALIDQATDLIVMQGSEDQLRQAGLLLEAADVPPHDILLKFAVLESSSTKSKDTSFNGLLSLLSGRFNIGLAGATLGNFARLKLPSLDVVLSASRDSGDFKIVSRPVLRLTEGFKSKFVVGQDVPVLGALTYNGPNASPVQSVDYRSSGVILNAKATLLDKAVLLEFDQEVSSFSETSTGVNTSPTLSKKTLNSTLYIQPGETVLIGGLSDEKTSSSKSGFSFLPDLFSSRSKASSSSDLVLAIEAQIL